MLVSSTQPTLALDAREVSLALACRAPLAGIPQKHRAGEWLELQFRDADERDLWLMLLETAFERADMDMPTFETVPAGAMLPYPTDDAHADSGAARNAMVYTAFWLALVVAGTLAVLGIFAH